jgi:hypothetical protein
LKRAGLVDEWIGGVWAKSTTPDEGTRPAGSVEYGWDDAHFVGIGGETRNEAAFWAEKVHFY